MPPTSAQRLTFRTYSLALRLMALELSVVQGLVPPPSTEFLLDVRQTKGEIGLALQTERARRRFLSGR